MMSTIGTVMYCSSHRAGESSIPVPYRNPRKTNSMLTNPMSAHRLDVGSEWRSDII
jgi:hypothetical protein